MIIHWVIDISHVSYRLYQTLTVILTLTSVITTPEYNNTFYIMYICTTCINPVFSARAARALVNARSNLVCMPNSCKILAKICSNACQIWRK